MSELIQTANDHRGLRWKLLATVSAVAIASNAYLSDRVEADDSADQPTVWVELGGQLERVDGGQTAFSPKFFDAISAGGLRSPLELDRPARYSNGFEGKASIDPSNSDWIFSGAVRYGRSTSNKFLHQQPQGTVTRFPLGGKYRTKTAADRYAETNAHNSESHLIVDFQAGKDVGLGMFGSGATSNISLGVRFAQLSEEQSATIRARPDVHLVVEPVLKYQIPATFYHRYSASFERATNFRGVGPSLSWNASAPLSGTKQSGVLTLDWGVNAAALFGRQKTRSHHQSSGLYHYYMPQHTQPTIVQLPTAHGTGSRTRNAIVPNVGAFAGLSFDYSNAKVSFGYRGDFFFGAVDGGLDSRRTYNREYFGPFATITVGLGG